MSQGRPIPYNEAFDRASELVMNLEVACARIAIAGSLRRRRPTVSDIELVALPRVEQRPGPDLWQTPVDVDVLQECISTMLHAGVIRGRDVEIHRADGRVETGQRMGDRYLALEYRGLPVDLFIVRPPADWGVVFAIRTGPGDWNQRIVTDCQRYLRRVDEGRVYRAGEYVPCPDERDFFTAVGQAWIEPEDRHVSKVRIQPRAVDKGSDRGSPSEPVSVGGR